MQRRANFRSPLLGLERAQGGYPNARFRTRMRGPVLGTAVVVFLLVDLFLVYRLTRDDDVVPSARLPVGSLDEPVAGSSAGLPDALDGRDGTEVGTPMLSAEEPAGMGGAKPATSSKQAKKSGSGSDTGSTNAVSGSSTSTTSDSGGSTSGGSSTGSGSGGSTGSGSGSSDLRLGGRVPAARVPAGRVPAGRVPAGRARGVQTQVGLGPAGRARAGPDPDPARAVRVVLEAAGREAAAGSEEG